MDLAALGCAAAAGDDALAPWRAVRPAGSARPLVAAWLPACCPSPPSRSCPASRASTSASLPPGDPRWPDRVSAQRARWMAPFAFEAQLRVAACGIGRSVRTAAELQALLSRHDPGKGSRRLASSAPDGSMPSGTSRDWPAETPPCAPSPLSWRNWAIVSRIALRSCRASLRFNGMRAPGRAAAQGFGRRASKRPARSAGTTKVCPRVVIAGRLKPGFSAGIHRAACRRDVPRCQDRCRAGR